MQTGIHEVHERTRVIASLLHDHKVGDTVTYEDFIEEIRMDVRLSTNRGYLHTARRMEERRGRVWETIRNVGLVLRNDVEAVVVAQGKLGLARNAVRRTGRTLRAIDGDRLPKPVHTKWSMLRSLTAIMGNLSSDRSQKVIAASVEDDGVKAINRRVLRSIKQT